MVLWEKGTKTSVNAFRGETVRKFSGCKLLQPTPGLEVTRVLLAMALSKDLTIFVR